MCGIRDDNVVMASKKSCGDPVQRADEDPDDETELSRNADVSRDLFEGDMVLTVDQAKQLLESAKAEKAGQPPQRRKRKVVKDQKMLWPSNVIYYNFERDLEESKKSIIYAGIKAWEDNTCLRFQEGTGRGDYITFMKGSGCYSHVGRGGGQQGISIGDGCEAVGIAAHEIAHALGFWHEQNRYDRRSYIRIETQNVLRMALMNFMRISTDMMNDYGVPYDLGSVMHYGSKAFSSSRSLNSITTIDPNYQNTIGQRQRLSFIDVKQMNMAYCSGVCRNQLRCQHDGYPDPAGGGSKCNRCRCPLGFGGALCEDVDESDAGCGGVISATSSWQSIRVALPSRRCSWLLKAPRGGHVILEIQKIDAKCRDTCAGFLEVKRGPNFDQTGYRFCCPGSWSNQIISSGTEMSLVYRAERSSNANWGVEFRFRTDAPANPPTSSGSSSARGLADGTWSQWSAWSQCSASCGSCGLKSRRRECVSGPCGTGLTTQRRTCAEAVCTKSVSLAIDSWCRYNAKMPCPTDIERHHRDQEGPQTIGPPGQPGAVSSARQRRQESTLEPNNCGTKNTYYMCARSSPYFVRLLTPEEMQKRVLSSEWNQARSSTRAKGPCCEGFEPQGDKCIRRRS